MTLPLPRISLKSVLVTSAAWALLGVPTFGQTVSNTPKAEVQIVLEDGEFKLGDITASNAGSESYVARIANGILKQVNTFNTRINHPDGLANVINAVPPMTIGVEGRQTYLIMNGQRKLAANGKHAANMAMEKLLRAQHISGGDLYVKRALIRSSAKDPEALNTDLQLASQYTSLVARRNSIEGATETPMSAWFKKTRDTQLAVLKKGDALGLGKSTTSDFYGGLRGYADSLKRRAPRFGNTPFLTYEDTAPRVIGPDLYVFRDLNKDGEVDADDERSLSTAENIFRSTSHKLGGAGFRLAPVTKDTEADLSLSILSPQDDAIMVGTSADNILHGGAAYDWLDGAAGHDTLNGGAGHDVLLGRAGDDILRGGGGNDDLYAGLDNDQLFGGEGNDKLFGGLTGSTQAAGGPGDDIFYIQADAKDPSGENVFTGGEGLDTLSFKYWGETIDMRLGGKNTKFKHGEYSLESFEIENLEGSKFSDTLRGNAQNNRIIGGAGDDNIGGGGGDDIIDGGWGADRLRGGTGVDTLSYIKSRSGVDVAIIELKSLGSPHAFGGSASGDHFEDTFENLTGSQFADVLEGNAGDNVITGARGDDYFIATNGADHYAGGSGFDTIDYGNHKGKTGLSIEFSPDGEGLGVTGYDDGQTSPNGRDTMTGIEHIVGTPHADTLRFGRGDNVLEAGKGDDTLYGGQGDDIYFIEVGGGHDRIFEEKNQGYDTIMLDLSNAGSWDNIALSIAGGELTVTVKGQRLATAINGPKQGEKSNDIGIEAIDFAGSGKVDIFALEAETNGPSGSPGNDNLRGHAGLSNLLQGFDGNDVIIGAPMNSPGQNSGQNSGQISGRVKGDILHGGRGNDVLRGGVGDDVYIFDLGSGADEITDAGGQDRIQFGPNIRKKDLIFEIMDGDLFIGLKAPRKRRERVLSARQVPDHIRIIGGGDVLAPSGAIERYTLQDKTLDIDLKDIKPAAQPPPEAAARAEYLWAKTLVTSLAAIYPASFQSMVDKPDGNPGANPENSDFLMDAGIISALAEHCKLEWSKKNFLPLMQWQRKIIPELKALGNNASVMGMSHGIYKSHTSAWIRKNDANCEQAVPILKGNLFADRFSPLASK